MLKCTHENRSCGKPTYRGCLRELEHDDNNSVVHKYKHHYLPPIKEH